MAAQLGTHPSADVKRTFAVGKVDDRTAAEIMSHLDGCHDCCRAAVALPSRNRASQRRFGLRQFPGRMAIPLEKVMFVVDR
jgi:hypothetical protein